LVGGRYVASALRQREDFRRRFETTYGTPPPTVASLAYDAAAIALVLADPVDDRRYDRQTLTVSYGFTGADGLFRLRPDGTTERGLAIFQIRRKDVRILEPAPTRFEDAIN
jgi:hypothetical protein